jgi:hypothetical protein
MIFFKSFKKKNYFNLGIEAGVSEDSFESSIFLEYIRDFIFIIIIELFNRDACFFKFSGAFNLVFDDTKGNNLWFIFK